MPKYITCKTLREEAEQMVSDGCTSREDLIKAVELTLKLKQRAEELNRGARAASEAAKTLGAMAAEWAIRSKKRCDSLFDREPFSTLKGETMQGEINGEDGTVYRLTQGVPAILRAKNANMTQEYLATLPKNWVDSVMKLVPAWDAARKDPNFHDLLDEHKLEERPSFKWEKRSEGAADSAE